MRILPNQRNFHIEQFRGHCSFETKLPWLEDQEHEDICKNLNFKLNTLTLLFVVKHLLKEIF